MCCIWSQVAIQWTLIFIIKVTFHLILWACIIAAQSGDTAGVPEITRHLPQACWNRLASTKRQNCTRLAKTPSQWRWASMPAHSEKQHRPGWDPTQSPWALLRGGGVGQGGSLKPSAMETRRSRDHGSILLSTFSFRCLSDQKEMRRKSDWPLALLVFPILFVLGTFHSAHFQVWIQIYLPCRVFPGFLQRAISWLRFWKFLQ